MKIGIVAIGLIGGSILKSLSQREDLEIFVVSRNLQSLEKAKEYTNNVSTELTSLNDCDVIFTCTPIGNTLETLDALEPIAKKSCIVTDVSSVKEFVMKKQRPYIFIGSHPMAGTENSGFDASFKELFERAKWVITPSKGTPEKELHTLKSIIEIIGAKPIICDAAKHDKAVALISHMPMLISQAIFDCASENDLALSLASSGFRDMTRLAMSNTNMANDMLIYNKENIEKACDDMILSLNKLSGENYHEMISEIKSSREKMYSKEGKNLL